MNGVNLIIFIQSNIHQLTIAAQIQCTMIKEGEREFILQKCRQASICLMEDPLEERCIYETNKIPPATFKLLIYQSTVHMADKNVNTCTTVASMDHASTKPVSSHSLT